MKFVDINEDILKVVSWSNSEHIKNIVHEIKQNNNKALSVDFELPSINNTETFDEFIKIVNQENVDLSNVTVSFSINKNDFSKQEFLTFNKLNKQLPTQKLYLRQNDTLWSGEDVLTTQTKLEELVKFAESTKLSPLEQVMVILDNISENKYKTEDDNESKLISRSVFGVLNSDKIVCSGYANLFKSAVDYLGSNNIKCWTTRVDITDDSGKDQGKHEFCVVYLEDEKYNIKGCYALDPTWCAGTNSLTYFMLNFEDLNHFSNQTMSPIVDDTFTVLYSNNHNWRTDKLNENVKSFFNDINVNLTEKREKFIEFMVSEKENLYLERVNKLNTLKSLASKVFQDKPTVSPKQASLLCGLLKRLTLRKLNAQNYEKELNKFKQTCTSESENVNVFETIKNWYNTTLSPLQEENNKLLKSLAIGLDGKISSSYYENVFLSNQLKKTFNASTPINITAINAALNYALVMAKRFSPYQAKDKVDVMIKNTAKRAKQVFIVPACSSDIIKNSVTLDSFNDRKQKEIERRKLAKQRKTQKQTNSDEQLCK